MMVEVRNIETGYGELQVIHNVSMEIDRHEIVALVGANGAGKSTLIQTICGLLPVSSGTIKIEGRHIENTPAHTIIHHGIALVPEGRRLFPYMTVLENLEMGAYVEKDPKKVRSNLDWVFGIFPKLKERQHQLAGTFSGGEQQMLTIGRALMSRPKFIILDEPSLGLAPVIVDDVFKVLQVLHKEGVTILLVEQNVRKSLEISDRAYVLENGRVTMSGLASDLLTNDEVKKAYLGL